MLAATDCRFKLGSVDVRDGYVTNAIQPKPLLLQLMENITIATEKMKNPSLVKHSGLCIVLKHPSSANIQDWFMLSY